LKNIDIPSNIIIDKDKKIPLVDTKKSGELGTIEIGISNPLK
jgi:hypothetical protein